MTPLPALVLLALAAGNLTLQPQSTAQSGGEQKSIRPGDSIAVQYEGNRPGSFQLLPKFDTRTDTAGFRYIPNHTGFNDSILTDAELRVIKRVDPQYPDSARRAGLEGRVIVKMWVNEKGKVTKASVMKSDAAIFNKPAIDAALQFEFALTAANKKTAGRWVSYPFQFRLK